MNGRFSKPHYNAFNQSEGVDPLKKFLDKSRTKRIPLDLDNVQKALIQPGIYDANFRPLHEIMSHPYWSGREKVQVLIKCLMFGPDVNHRDANQETPLHFAFRFNEPELLKVAVVSLVERGADLNVLDKNGKKALHYVIETGHPELIPAMIARQATAGKTANGDSLSNIALDRFTRSMHRNIANDSEHFQSAIKAYYRSMAYVKSYKLHEAEFSLEDDLKKLLNVCKKQPGYRNVIDDVEKKIGQVDPAQKLPRAQLPRANTSPDHVFKLQEGNDAHPWLGGFSSFMDKLTGSLNIDTYLTYSKHRTTDLFNNPELINSANVMERLRRERSKIDIDYVLMDSKFNLKGDTFLTKLARISNIAGISNMVDLHANLNAQDFEGNTAMHLLAKNCQNRGQLLIGLKHLVGVPNAEGRINTLGGGTNHADRDIVNFQGQTFMDILQEMHPEWSHEFSVELGAQPLQPKLPELEMTKVLLLEGPTEM